MAVNIGNSEELSIDNKKPASIHKASDPDLLETCSVIRGMDEYLEDLDKSESKGKQPHVFSHEYEAQKKEMLQMAFQSNEKISRERPSKRHFHIPAVVAAGIAVIAIAAGSMNLSADAMPEPMRVFMMRVNTLFSETRLNENAFYADNQATDFPKELQVIYEPTKIAEGYEVSDTVTQSKKHMVRYKNENEKEYVYRQSTYDGWMGYNSEDAVYEQIKINGQYEGIIFVLEEKDVVIQWQQSGYVFELYGDLEYETLEELAASIKVMEE